jgi:hypothetical protein
MFKFWMEMIVMYLMTIKGVWIGGWIYWAHTNRNYSAFAIPRTRLLTTAHTKSSKPLLPSFIKTGSGIQKLTGGDTQTHTHTHGQQRDLISLLYFFKIRKYDKK